MCEFHESNSNSFGDIWWTDKLIYFRIIDEGQNDRWMPVSGTSIIKSTLVVKYRDVQNV